MVTNIILIIKEKMLAYIICIITEEKPFSIHKHIHSKKLNTPANLQHKPSTQYAVHQT